MNKLNVLFISLVLVCFSLSAEVINNPVIEKDNCTVTAVPGQGGGTEYIVTVYNPPPTTTYVCQSIPSSCVNFDPEQWDCELYSGLRNINSNAAMLREIKNELNKLRKMMKRVCH